MAGCTGSQAVLLPLWPADEHLRGCWLLLLHKCAGRPEASAGPSDKPSLSFSLFSLRVAAASGVSFVRCAHRHTTPLGEPTLVQPDPDDAWTSLADGLGVIWRAELAFSELLLHARRASLAGRPKPPNIVRWVKLRTCRGGGQMVWPFHRTTRLATCCLDFPRYCLAD